MKITLAYIKRWFHLIYYLIRLDTDHCGFVIRQSVTFFGIHLYYKKIKIGCVCGKIFYNEE
jgi:hypothetical protein